MFYLKLAGQKISENLLIVCSFYFSQSGPLYLDLFHVPAHAELVMKIHGNQLPSIGLGVVVLTFSRWLWKYIALISSCNNGLGSSVFTICWGWTRRRWHLVASIELLFIFLLVIVLGSAFADVFANVLYLILWIWPIIVTYTLVFHLWHLPWPPFSLQLSSSSKITGHSDYW